MIFDTYARRIVLIALDVLIVAVAYALAYQFTLGVKGLTQAWLDYKATLGQTLPYLIGIRLLCGMLVKQYTWSFRFASLAEGVNLLKGSLAGSLIFFLVFHLLVDLEYPPPRSVYILEFFFTLSGFCLIRFFPRYAYQQYVLKRPLVREDGGASLRTLIYGAGATGELLLRDFLRVRIYPYQVVGFIDDDPARWGASIHGVRVLGAASDLPVLLRENRIEKLLIAVPDLAPAKLREIVDLCADCHVRFKIVPAYAKMITAGDAAPITLKDVQLEDLLQRDPVTFEENRMAEFFLNRTVLVTGAAGSIGSEICRQVIRHGARRLVAVDLNENDMYFLRMELAELRQAQEHGQDITCDFRIASVRDPKAMDAIFAREKPHLVFHAAAHKHVPAMEACPLEALKNNVLGTRAVAEAADAHGVDCFVLISTDKAVRPTSVMGCSKRMAEFVVQELDERSATRFMTVRFGNVLGSNGSLIQILHRQIAQGGPVTITHPKIKRFFMTIPEAVGLVLVAAVQNEGALCVLEMGEQVVIERLARQLISLSGLIPDKDIPIVYTGLRPGEKLYEELFTEEETLGESTHPKIRLVRNPAKVDVPAMLRAVRATLEAGDEAAVRPLLDAWVPGYAPMDPAVEGHAAAPSPAVATEGPRA